MSKHTNHFVEWPLRTNFYPFCPFFNCDLSFMMIRVQNFMSELGFYTVYVLAGLHLDFNKLWVFTLRPSSVNPPECWLLSREGRRGCSWDNVDISISIAHPIRIYSTEHCIIAPVMIQHAGYTNHKEAKTYLCICIKSYLIRNGNRSRGMDGWIGSFTFNKAPSHLPFFSFPFCNIYQFQLFPQLTRQDTLLYIEGEESTIWQIITMVKLDVILIWFETKD